MRSLGAHDYVDRWIMRIRSGSGVLPKLFCSFRWRLTASSAARRAAYEQFTLPGSASHQIFHNGAYADSLQAKVGSDKKIYRKQFPTWDFLF
jgi:hypothetical protein